MSSESFRRSRLLNARFPNATVLLYRDRPGWFLSAKMLYDIDEQPLQAIIDICSRNIRSILPQSGGCHPGCRASKVSSAIYKRPSRVRLNDRHHPIPLIIISLEELLGKALWTAQKFLMRHLFATHSIRSFARMLMNMARSDSSRGPMISASHSSRIVRTS